MKKLVKTMAVLALTVSIGFSVIGAATVYQTVTGDLRPDMTIKLNNETLTLKDAAGKNLTPVLINGSTYLPVRAVAEATGLKVDWDGENQTVSLSNQQAKVDVRGTVKNLVLGKDGITMLVEGVSESGTTYDKATVTVNRSTVILNQDGSTNSLTYADIKEGDQVEVIFDGAVAESYPVMGVAAQLKILSTTEKIGVRGKVISIENQADGIMMYVEGQLESDTQFDRAKVTATKDTVVIRRGIQTFAPLDYTEIKVGDQVEVIFKGGVSKSIPVIGAAKQVEIIVK